MTQELELVVAVAALAGWVDSAFVLEALLLLYWSVLNWLHPSWDGTNSPPRAEP